MHAWIGRMGLAAGLLAVGGCGGETTEDAGTANERPAADGGGAGMDDAGGGMGDPGSDDDAPLSAIPDHCPTTVATGTDVGQVPPNLELYDAAGEAHRLWDHCGELIYLVAGARW